MNKDLRYSRSVGGGDVAERRRGRGLEEWRFHGAVPLEESNALRSRESGKSGLVVGMYVRARPLARRKAAIVT